MPESDAGMHFLHSGGAKFARGGGRGGETPARAWEKIRKDVQGVLCLERFTHVFGDLTSK